MGPSPLQEIGAGCFAAVADSLTTHPIDQIKTQFQINKHANGSVWYALSTQFTEGGLPRLYRGVAAACMRPGPICVYTGNEWAVREVGTVELFTRGSTTDLTIAGTLFAGFLTGYPEAAGVTPFEVVKVRLQSLEHVGKYKDSVQCAKSILKEESISALYRGFGATCARNCTFNGIFFGMIKATREEFGLDHNPAADFILGIGAAFVATCFKLPFDIAKSRIQNQLPVPASASGPKSFRYTGVLQCLSTVAKDEGILALYKGFVPTSIRMMLGMSVSHVAFEGALRQATRYNVPQ